MRRVKVGITMARELADDDDDCSLETSHVRSLERREGKRIEEERATQVQSTVATV
jgi:hypothetical protein